MSAFLQSTERSRIGRLDGWSTDLALSVAALAVQKLPGLIGAIVLTRYFDKALMGQFFFCGVAASMAALISHLGTDRDLQRAVAQRPEIAMERFGQVMALRLAAVLFTWPALNLALWLIAPEMLGVALLTSLYILIGDLFFTPATVFVGLRRLGSRLATGAIGPLLIVAASLAVFLGMPLLGVLALYAAANAIMLAVTLLIFHRTISPVRLDWRLDRLRPILVTALPFFLAEILVTLESKIDTGMIFAMVGTVAVADYEAAYRLLEVSRTMVRPMLMVFFPIGAAMAVIGRRDELRRLFGRLVSTATLLGLAVTAISVPMAEFLTVGIWGASYAASAPYFAVLSLSTAPIFLVLLCITLAGALHREWQALWAILAAAVLNLVLNLVAIPAFGPIGAAWTTVATETLAAFLLLGVLHSGAKGAILPARRARAEGKT